MNDRVFSSTMESTAKGVLQAVPGVGGMIYGNDESPTIPGTPKPETVNQKKLDEIEAANQRQTLIGASVRESLRTDSERYRKSLTMSRTLGVPADVAYRQIDLATQTAKKQELENILQANPGLTACFADPSLAKGIADDVPNLAEIEASLREQRSLGMKFKRAGAALASGTLQLGTGSVYGVPGMILGGLSEYVTAPLARNEWLPADPFAGPADQLLSMASPENGPIGALNEFSNRNAGKYERMVYSGFQSLGMNIPLYAALAITKNPNVILPMFGAATAGEGAGRGRREGKSFGQSIAFGAELGAFEVLTEMIPAGKFVEDLANDTGFAKMLFGNVAREQVGEQIATATQDLTEWVHLNPEGTLKDYLEARPEAALSTAIATLVASGGQVSVGYAVDRGMRAITERDQKAQLALRTEDYTKRLVRAAAASKVNSSDPETFEAAVEKIVAEGGGSDSVYIDAKALSEALYQDQVDDLLAGMPEVQAQLKEALATGGDVRIPIQQFAAKLAAKPAMGGLTRHVRFDPDDMSPAEAEQHMKEQTERMSEEVARIVGDEAQAAVFETERKAVEDTIASDLTKVGRFRPNVGRAYAQYASTWYANMAARVGMTPQAFYDQYQVRIQGEALIGASDLEQRPEPPRFNQRRVQDDAVSVTLVHYSHRGGLKRLDGSWAGTGSAGAERRRFGMGRYGLSEPKGSTKRRLYFYVQKGNEIPQAEEVVTGKNIYRVQADNLYDLDADPRNLKEEAGRNIDYLEELINEQGFDGFVTDWTGEQGIKAPVAILFGLSKTVPVEQVGALSQEALSAPPLRTDNPGGGWLENEQRRTNEAGRRPNGAYRRFGEVTGYYDTPVVLPVDLLAKIRGLNSEQENVRQDSLNSLKQVMGETGQLPTMNGRPYVPFIQVDKDGVPWVNEGNHRIMAAAELGWEAMPVEIRYYAGGEEAAGPLSPENVARLATVSGVLYQRQLDTKTVAFREWFGDSKVVDENGEPMLMYHGSAAEFVRFETSISGDGFYFTSDSEAAAGFAEGRAFSRPGTQARVYQVYLNIRNPLRLNGDDEATRQKYMTRQFDTRELASQGYDGVIVSYSDGETEAMVFASEQIKSVFNRGTFSPTDPNILYQGPKEWVTLEPNQDPNEPINPLTPFVQLDGIKGAQGRLTRALARDADVGGVKNERTVLENETDRFVFGKLTVQDWWDRVRRNLSPDDIRAARKWYGDLHNLMAQFFGEKDASKMALAWLLSQQNTSPSGGMLNVLRAVDMAMGKPQIKQAGLGQEKLIETLRGQIPKKGYDAKLLDFIDSELKKRTRTVMGNDPRGGQPAVIDVWANRDVGKVDNRVLEYIKNTFGEEAAAGVEVDGEGIAEAQYEWGSKFYQDLIADLNAAAVDGGNWTGFEAQAVGWVAMQRQLGSEAEFPQDLFDKNTYRVSIGLQTGAGTIFAGAGEIQDKATMRVLKTAADLVGVKIRIAEKGLGSYLGDQEGAVQVDVLGSPESLRDFAAVVGHALRQTEVLISRPLKTGKTQGITFRLTGSDTLKNPSDAAALVDLIKAKLQEKIHANEFEAAEENLDSAVNKRAMKAAGIKPAEWKKLTPEERDEKRAGFYRTTNIGDGFQMVSENGVPVIRIFHSTYEVNREAEHELMEKMPEHPVNLRAMRESGTTAEQWAALTPEQRDELRADYYRGRVKWTGNWGSKELEELMNVAEEIKSEETPLELEVSNFDVQFEHNDWETYPDGAGYRDSLLERGREATARDLDAEPGLRLLQDEVRPAGERGPSQVLGRLGEFFQEGVEPVFYSQLIRAVEGLKQEKGPASQWVGIIKNLTQRGVKPEELEWLGVVEWLGEQTGSVTKQEILDYLNANRVEVREVVSTREYTLEDKKRVAAQLLKEDIANELVPGDATWETIGQSQRKAYLKDAQLYLASGRGVDAEGNWTDLGSFPPKYTQFTLPGGKNNIELLITLRERPGQAQRERFIGSHYHDVADILVHIRGNERIDVDGKRVFFMEEDQSDWHREGRKRGYGEPTPLVNEREPEMVGVDDNGDAIFDDGIRSGGRVPNAPFKESWAMLGMKRVIRWAAENGYDRVAWTTGEQQKDRYNLSKHVDSILVWTTEPEEGETRYFFEAKKDGRVVASDKNSATGLSANELENQLGKDIAGKAVEDLKAGNRAEYTGDDLKIGGEWAVNLYDKYLVNNTNKFIKKYGARVGTTKIDTGATVREHRRQDGRTIYESLSPNGAVLAGPFGTFEEARDALNELWPDATVHAFDITDELRAAALAGLPYFQQKRGAFSPSSRTITLLKDADLSTFLHEFGHFQLEVMAEIAARPDAPADIVKDMDTLLAWFGVKDLQTWNDMTLEQQRQYHEKFAEGIEKYLFTGEAPSTELRSIFARFRAWMLSVYKSIRNMKVQLTPEVTQVFDRMLASEDAIKAAEATRGFRAIFTTAEEAGMTPEEWLKYQELGSQATEDAAADLERRSLKDMQWLANAKSRELKKLQAKAAALRKKTAEAIRAELLQTPVYAVQEFIKNGTMPEGFALTRAQEKISVELGQLSGKLSLAELKALYGEGEAAPYRYLPRNLVSAEGLPVQPVAELFGFSSVDHMVKAIVEANPIDQEVEGLTDQRMLEEHGELVDPRAVERAAEAAIHNQARMRFVATELSALEKAMAAKAPAGTDRKGRKRTTNATIQAAREYAKVAVARMKIADARRNGKYSAAESRAGREAEKSLKKGNLAEAAMHKRSQILSGFLYRETSKAVEEIERILEYLKKFSSEGTRKGLDQEYLDQIDSLLERMDLRKGVTAAEVAKRKSLAEWVAAQQEAGFEPEIPPELLNEAVRQHYSQMTVEEFRGLRDTVKQIEHLGRLKKKLLTAKDQREFEAIVADIVSSIEANSPGKEIDNRTGNRPIDYAVRLFKGYFASHRKVSSLARQMDGFKDGGKMWEYIVRTMNEAGDREATMREQATIKLMDLLKPLKGERMGGKGLYIQAIGRSLNREARLAVALNVGNAGNKQRLMSGEQWDEGQLQAVLDTLTKEEWDFVQSVWDMFEQDYKPLVAEKERRVGGKEPNWVEPTPVQTRFGEYRGGYYPIKFDPRASQRAAEHADAEAARQEMRAAYTSATTRRSFTKARADEVVDRPLMLSFDGIYQGVNEVIHDLAWHEWLIDVNRLLKNKALASAIRNNYGADVYNQFKLAFRDIARGEQPAQNAFESSLNHIRVGATVTGLGWNVMTSLLQPLGLTQSFVRIGTRWVAKGIGEFMSNPLEATRKVYEKSEFMRIRGKTLNREINEVRNVVAEKSKARNAIEQSFFFLIQKAQLGADIPTWLGAYEKAQAEGNDEARSVALADQAVLDSQSGGQVKDLATIQRGSPALKLFTNFISYFNLTYNLAAESYHRTDFKKPADVLALGVDYLMLLVLPSVLGTLLREAVTGGDDDDDELVKKLIADQIGYLLGLFVGVREVTAGVQAALGVSPYAMGYSGPAGTRFFAEVAKFGQQIDQGELDMALVKSAVNVAGVALHLPSAQINRTMTGVVALIEGDTTDPRVLLSGYRKQ